MNRLRHTGSLLLMLSLAACATPAPKPAASSVAAPPAKPAAPARSDPAAMTPIPNPTTSMKPRTAVPHQRPASQLPPPRATPRRQAAPAPPAPTPSAANLVRAAQLRGQGLEQLNRGSVDRAVALLQQASQLDPNNALIKRDLERAQRIAAAVKRQ